MFEVEVEFIQKEKLTVKAFDATHAEDEACKQLYEKYPEVPKASVTVLTVEEING